MKFFYGTEGSGKDIKMGDGFVAHIAISAATLWNGKKFKNYRPPMHSELFLDSGGYSFFTRYNDYPFNPFDLALLGGKLGARYIATMDLPCEPLVRREGNLRTNRERIDATVEYACRCLDADSDLPWIPVIQGYYLDEYQYCIEKYREAGIDRGLWAVGSICIRKDLASTKLILKLIRRAFPNDYLHAFGIDLRFIKDRWVRNNIDATDSQAWHFGNYDKGIFLPRTQAEALDQFKIYKKKVDEVLNSKNNTHSIFEFDKENQDYGVGDE